MAQLLTPRQVRSRGIRQPIWPLIDRTHPINRGLVGYWQCDGEGVLVPDYSGWGNNGVATAVGLKDSHHGGNALSFSNASNSNIIISDGTASITKITGNSPRSISVWVNPASTISPLAIFSYGVGTTNNLFAMYNNSSVAGDVYIAGIGNDVSIGGGNCPVNTWTHVVFTYNGGSILPLGAGVTLFYINTITPNQGQGGSGAAWNTSASSTLHIGDDIATAGRSYDGRLEGLRWYNRVLDPVEVRQLYVEPYIGIVDAAASIIPTGIVPPVGLPLMGQIWLA
jgi:hypothetical protein